MVDLLLPRRHALTGHRHTLRWLPLAGLLHRLRGLTGRRGLRRGRHLPLTGLRSNLPARQKLRQRIPRRLHRGLLALAVLLLLLELRHADLVSRALIA